jgi:hypothetical protein
VIALAETMAHEVNTEPQVRKRPASFCLAS